MKLHVASVHEEKKPFICGICDYSCSKKTWICRHVAHVHEGEKPFKCEICDYCFSEKQQMKQHIARKHKEKIFDKWNW